MTQPITQPHNHLITASLILHYITQCTGHNRYIQKQNNIQSPSISEEYRRKAIPPMIG